MGFTRIARFEVAALVPLGVEYRIRPWKTISRAVEWRRLGNSTDTVGDVVLFSSAAGDFFVDDDPPPPGGDDDLDDKLLNKLADAP